MPCVNYGNLNCTCDTEEIESHRCPYTDDINNEYDLPDSEVNLCECCDYCTQQCAEDI